MKTILIIAGIVLVILYLITLLEVQGEKRERRTDRFISKKPK